MADPITICLIGEHGSGKSTISGWLAEAHGLQRLHPFSPGRAMTSAYFVALGASCGEAAAMVNGKLKDLPSPFLPRISADDPGSPHRTPRFFMDKLGRYTGVDMGADWTIGAEMVAVRRPRERMGVDIGGLSVTDAMAAAYLVYCGMDGEQALAVLDDPREAMRPCAVLPRLGDADHATVQDLRDFIADFFEDRLGSEWPSDITVDAAHGGEFNAGGFRNLNAEQPDPVGYVVESSIHEMARIAAMPGAVIVRILADDTAPSDTLLTSITSRSIREDLSFHNPKTGFEEVGRLFDRAMAEAGHDYGQREAREEALPEHDME